MVISAAKGFGISMQNSGQITDKLTIALNKSLLHVEELPHAIGELAGRANQYGQSFDSSLTALMTMRDQGMSAAQGSQDFLHALQSASKIGNDTVLYKRTKSYFTSLGVTDGIFNKDTRQLKEYPELIADMEKAMINQGYINPKYKKGITDEKTFHDFLAKNGGVAPKDFWDSQKAMPLISKVFGAAGTAPILMGLQSKYEEVNKETGEKTGKVYYGADALRQMYKDVKNSDGAVNDTHKIIAESGAYQLKVLSGAWDAAQIKLMDGMVPLIKTGAEALTKVFNPGKKEASREPGQPLNMEDYEPYKSPFTTVREALKETVKGYKNTGHPFIAGTLDTVGNAAINGAQISTTMPSVAKQIGGAFSKDIVKADWGDSLIEFPWHIVKNGIKFVSDIVKANKDFDDAVKELPENLQDPAKLMEGIIKGGIVLMVTGAVIKTIELGVRGVSLAMKGTKIATSLTESILGLFTGKKDGKGGGLSKLLGNNMAIKANIVNVYGTAVNGGAGAAGAGARTAGAAGTAATAGSAASKIGRVASFGLRYGGPIAIGADLVSGALGGPSFIKSAAQSKYNPLNPHTEEKINEMHKILKDPSKANTGKKQAEIVPESNFFKPKANTDKGGNITSSGTLGSGSWKPVIDDLKGAVNKFTNLFPKGKSEKEQQAEAGKIVEAAKSGSLVINSSILDGFSQANSKLQNIKLQNAVSVVVQPPQVNVSGNIDSILKVKSQGSSSFSSRAEQGGTAWDRMQALNQRRNGWR
jgi:hypothetical protein